MSFTIDKLSAVYDILIYLHEKPEEHISSATATYINTYSLLNCYTKYKVKSGQKTSRAINKICTELGVDKLDGYNKIFAEISDALTPLSINRKCILSANFMDFMTMANGNSWTTCHNIGIEKNKIGSYAAGPAFYGTDEVSLIFYTLDNENITEKYFMQPKVTRQIFFYQNGTLIQERLYPKTHDNDCVNDKNSLSAIYRKTVESVISRCEDKSDMWREADVRIQRNDNCLMYPDWERFYNWRMQLNGKDGTSLIIVGGDTYCFQCGEPKTDDYTGDIRCSVCIDGIAFN